MADLSKPRYEFIEGLMPLVLMVNHAPLQLEDIEPVFGRFRELAKKRVKFVSLSDARTVTASTDARTRKALGDASKKIQDEARGFSLGSGVIVSSAIVRGALTAIEWLSQPEQPMVYFSSMPAAIDWALERIKGAGLEVTPAIAAFRAKQLRLSA